MTPVRSLTRQLHRIGPTVTGLWCPHCQAPTGISIPFAVVDARTLLILARIPATHCTACGEPITKEGP